MPFDFHNKDRIKNLLEELEELRYHSLQEIPEFLWYEDDGKTGNRTPMGEPRVVSPGFRWKDGTAITGCVPASPYQKP